MITAPDLADVQGLLRSAYTTLPAADYSLFRVTDAEGGRRLLAALTDKITVVPDRDVAVVTQVAVTATGLAALGVPAAVVATFAPEFRAGMSAPDRARFLADRPHDWDYGGPATPAVDFAVITFAVDRVTLDDAVEALDALAATNGTLLTRRLAAAPPSAHEPFGFRDGISEPYVTELATSRQRRTAGSTRPVALGEFLLGYQNAYGLVTQRPVLPVSADPAGLLPRSPEGADLGRNGTYLVLRTLAQDVDTFDDYLTRTAASTGMSSELLAAKMIGRWRNGAPLALSPDTDREDLQTANGFGYHREDPQGLRCPIGAHVRRVNPRDSLDPRPGSDRSVEVTDRHRLIRRGRTYADGSGVGLHFLAINANLGRQFEFVQHTWLNSPKFDGLYADVEPLLAPRTPDGVFTIPGQPVRTRISELPDFVTTRGGAYLFLPGLRALRYLAAGAW